MSLEIKIPPMGESITGGLLAAWHVPSGAAVAKGQHLYDLETDKITHEGLAPESGVVHFSLEAGAEVKIGQVIGTIAPATSSATPAPAPAPAPTADAPAPPLSPAAWRVAAETGIDPSSVAGSGKAGRVTKGDLLEAAARKAEVPAVPAPTPPPPAEAAAPAPAPAPTPAPFTRRKLSPIRRRIAERLVAAKQETALLTTFNEVDMSAVKDLRARYQEEFTKRHGIKLGFMSFFIRAAVRALREVPQVSWMLDGDHVIEPHYADIGVAVSTDKGLMVPVLRGCDRLSLAEIEKELAAFAAKAREGKITLEDLQGGVFSITNGGVFGSLLSTPILNPPQSAILGMHAIQDRPVALGGQVVIRPMMYLALSYDHRIVDGREAVTFLLRIKQAVEDPARLLLDC